MRARPDREDLVARYAYCETCYECLRDLLSGEDLQRLFDHRRAVFNKVRERHEEELLEDKPKRFPQPLSPHYFYEVGVALISADDSCCFNWMAAAGHNTKLLEWGFWLRRILVQFVAYFWDCPCGFIDGLPWSQ